LVTVPKPSPSKWAELDDSTVLSTTILAILSSPLPGRAEGKGGDSTVLSPVMLSEKPGDLATTLAGGAGMGAPRRFTLLVLPIAAHPQPFSARERTVSADPPLGV
jgi:hypothetical protein